MPTRPNGRQLEETAARLRAGTEDIGRAERLVAAFQERNDADGSRARRGVAVTVYASDSLYDFPSELAAARSRAKRKGGDLAQGLRRHAQRFGAEGVNETAARLGVVVVVPGAEKRQRTTGPTLRAQVLDLHGRGVVVAGIADVLNILTGASAASSRRLAHRKRASETAQPSRSFCGSGGRATSSMSENAEPHG